MLNSSKKYINHLIVGYITIVEKKILLSDPKTEKKINNFKRTQMDEIVHRQLPCFMRFTLFQGDAVSVGPAKFACRALSYI